MARANAFVLGSEAERVRAPAGAFVAAPRNVVHTFLNESHADAHFLNFHTPDQGFADYLRGQRDGNAVPFDSFDPPADGGPSASEAIVSGPGEGERLMTGNRVVLLKGVLSDLCFAEWDIDGPFAGPDVHHHDAQVDSFYVVEGELDNTFNHTRSGRARVLNVHAPDGGFADFLRGISD